MFYSNEDYTVSNSMIDGEMRYFITYHTKGCKAPKVEITHEMFKLYCNEFRKPHRKQMENETDFRAYLNVEDYLATSKLDGGFLRLAADIEEISMNRIQLSEIEKLLGTCTKAQQRRFRLCIYSGISYSEAARLEQCAENAIRQSIHAVLKKIKIFFDTTCEFD